MFPAPAISGDTARESVALFSTTTANHKAFSYLHVGTRFLGNATEHTDEPDCRHTRVVKPACVQKSWRLARTVVNNGHSMVQQTLAKKCMVKRESGYKYEQTLEVMLSDQC